MSSSDNKATINHCQCANSKAREVVVITIETCCKRTCDEAQRKSSKALSGPESSSSGPVKAKPNAKGISSSPELTPTTTPEKPVQPQKVQRLYKLPVLTERYHGPGCAMEISVLEKHDDTCIYKKDDDDQRSVDDRAGSYECVGRMIFKTCNPEQHDFHADGVTGNFTGLSPASKTPAQPAAQALPPAKPAGPAQTPPATKAPAQPPAPAPDATPAPKPAAAPESKPAAASNSKPAAAPNSKPPQASAPKGDAKASKPTPSSEAKSDSQAAPAPLQAVPSSGGSVYESAQSQEPANEKPASAETQKPVEASSLKKSGSDNQQIMVITTDDNYGYLDLRKVNQRKHYRGDNCKLSMPKNPFILPKSEVQRLLQSKKMFPFYTDEANQTDSSSGDTRYSQDTITSLTDTKMYRKKKKGFFSSLFKRSSIESSSTTGSKKSTKSTNTVRRYK